ncbi:MAG: nuclease [Candidatus Roizmanbacteria bacterium GW2011_GWA2_35_19]|uniref:Nuclease n=2 Tax=Candidatus Roizmaniibacteriota TaxID=1752723 RepID=A0A0G0BPW9_9BACT|nr:MAG: nuclease [Candidatus Roizmanbacteria bacterium GW2011_GWC2_35_12]KKP71564.1 MAG: nuclease [Candidatus Roizmanbacteria bacterium GW2011_GWA2_35_19]
MKNKVTYLILVLFLMFASFFGGRYYEKKKINLSPITPIPPIQKLTVAEVSDGDTLKLSDGKTFRLYGVNAPEMKESYYKEAVEFTKNLTLGKEVAFEQEEKYKEDKFGRELGYVFVDGVNLNIELVRNGLARVVLYEKRAKIKYQDELLSAEKSAKEKNLGIWSSN